MITYKLFIEKNGNLKLRLTNNRKSTEISIGIKITHSELVDALSVNARGKYSAKHQFVRGVMDKVDNVRLRLLEEHNRDADVKVIAEYVRAELFGESKPVDKQMSFVEFFKKTGEAKAKSTNESFIYTLSTMTKYDNSVERKTFEDITYAWLSDFEAWMKKHDLSQNTRKIHFGNIRIAMRDAYKRELTNNDPFRRFSFRPEKTRKRSVEVDDLRALFSYNVEPFAELYRDMFKLIFMLCGINTIDLYNLMSVTSDGRVEYKRAKTGRLYSIKVEPEAMEIIEKYRGKTHLLCLADRWSDSRNFRHQMNAAIKRIGKAQSKGVKDKEGDGPFAHITSYWARHSWATIARKLKISVDDIALALGHSNGHETTRIYINEDLDAIDEANRRVLDWVLYGKK